jgi:hypothetical protein
MQNSPRGDQSTIQYQSEAMMLPRISENQAKARAYEIARTLSNVKTSTKTGTKVSLLNN